LKLNFRKFLRRIKDFETELRVATVLYKTITHLALLGFADSTPENETEQNRAGVR
jgi:hypothetical protein